MKATFLDSWKNGDGCLVTKWQLEPPYRGNTTVQVVPFRSVTRQFVTQVLSPRGEVLSEADKLLLGEKGLALIGYTR